MSRFHLEVTVAAVTASLFLVTLIWKDWIEIVSGVDPDRGSGALEWAIVLAMGLAALTSAVLARWEWKRAHLSPE